MHTEEDELKGALVITASLTNYPILRTMPNKDVRRVSGWALERGIEPEGFVLSDHADWNGLNEAIKASGAKRIYVQHGFTQSFSKHLRDQGYDAFDVTECIKHQNKLELF
jgi:putative mRNA 3-end processing factor